MHEVVISAGDLNRRISIQSQVTGAEVDAFRQSTAAAWIPDLSVLGQSIDIQGSQLVYSTAEFMSKVAHRITDPLDVVGGHLGQSSVLPTSSPPPTSPTRMRLKQSSTTSR